MPIGAEYGWDARNIQFRMTTINMYAQLVPHHDATTDLQDMGIQEHKNDDRLSSLNCIVHLGPG